MNARTLSSSLMTALAVALGSAFALSVSHAHAGELDPKKVEKVETISVGGGFLAGAVVGGPAGAVVGAIVGAVAGDHFLVRKENKLMAANLDATRDQLAYVQAANAQLAADLTAQRNLVASTSHEIRSASCCGDSELVLHFRSGSSKVEELYDDQLEEFVAYVDSVPGAVVEIYGYADRRGEQNDNLWLSQERVQSVEKSLRNLGLSNFTYETTALGEGQPVTATESLENNFFDRRVVLRVRTDEQNELASSSR
jgi:outer membrane protein OmpA-like peptidoglycan-associated protein